MSQWRAIKGAGVNGSFLELQGAQNIMYEPRDDVPGVSFVHDEKSVCQSEKGTEFSVRMSLADVKSFES